MFDRDSPKNMADTQPHFFRAIVIPMFDLLFSTFPGVEFDPIRKTLIANLQYWDNLRWCNNDKYCNHRSISR